MQRRVNRQVRLKSRPSGIPQAEHFEIVEAPAPDPSDGQVLVRNIYLSVEPAMRGTASVPSWDPIPQGPRVERHLLVKRARMQGFLIFDHGPQFPGALQELVNWVRGDLIHYREDILDGIEHAPGSIAGLYRGENLGKRLIRVAPEGR